LRIARPILLVSTPIGVLFGLREAWRLAGPKMAALMAAMLAVVGTLVWWTIRRIRQERALDRARLESGANQR
jgi:lysozyme family protein